MGQFSVTVRTQVLVGFGNPRLQHILLLDLHCWTLYSCIIIHWRMNTAGGACVVLGALYHELGNPSEILSVS